MPVCVLQAKTDKCSHRGWTETGPWYIAADAPVSWTCCYTSSV